ncbi:MAG TPA: hypothetical protein VFW62_06465 [bacterium]|nr:hypothetical protein [bacterium]
MRAMTAILMPLLAVGVFLDASRADFPKKVKSKGKIAAVSPGRIMLKDGTNNLRTFNILAGREVGVSVQGKLALADLKPGMLVRIEGTLKMNALQEEVSQITVYSPNDGYEVGIAQDSQDAPAIVTAAIKLVKGDALTLAAGKKRITARLAQEVVIEVDSKDYTLAPTGSLIEAEGYETKDGSVNAKKVAITVGKPAAPPAEVKKEKKK